VTFSVPAEAYDRYMGRYSVLLAPSFADFAGIAAGQRVLDVGCGPGALTGELVRRLGVERVAAVDPSESFVGAIEARYPGVLVERAAPAQEMGVEVAEVFKPVSAEQRAALQRIEKVTPPPERDAQMLARPRLTS